MRKEEIEKTEHSLKCWRERLKWLERQKFYTSAVIAKKEKKLKTLKSKLKKEMKNV